MTTINEASEYFDSTRSRSCSARTHTLKKKQKQRRAEPNDKNKTEFLMMKIGARDPFLTAHVDIRRRQSNGFVCC